MLKQKLILEVKGEARTYALEVSPDSPLGEIYDALSTMRAFVLQKMQDADKQPDTNEGTSE